MPAFPLISDTDLSRARRDPTFRQEMLAGQLHALIRVMASLQAAPKALEPELARSLREGADLAVKLSDLLKELAARAQARDEDASAPPEAR